METINTSNSKGASHMNAIHRMFQVIGLILGLALGSESFAQNAIADWHAVMESSVASAAGAWPPWRSPATSGKQAVAGRYTGVSEYLHPGHTQPSPALATLDSVARRASEDPRWRVGLRCGSLLPG